MDAIPHGCDLTWRDMNAHFIARALGGRRTGNTWMASCPAHDDHKPSLAISTGDQGKVLVHCHAGCDQTAVISALKARGLWEEPHWLRRRLVRRNTRRPASSYPIHDDTNRTAFALRIWRASASAPGTLVEGYLRSRGLQLLPPPTLRFHAGLRHRAGGIWPAMVALVTRGSDDVPLAIHRTFLARDGSGKAPVDAQKMMLGPCRGGAVRLGPFGGTLLVGEGIETCLSAMQATGTPAWAALSTTGLRGLNLPANVRDVTVLADGDDAGEAAARDAASRWRREGRKVQIARPPRGLDFNDALRGRYVARGAA